MINARSETVATKPAFKAAAARRRCLAPALGYFEWMRDSGKIPYFLHAANDVTFAMAGLYEVWRDRYPRTTRNAGFGHARSSPGQPATRWATCTTDARSSSHMQEAWLDCSGDDPRIAERLLADMPELHLELRRVSKARPRSHPSAPRA